MVKNALPLHDLTARRHALRVFCIAMALLASPLFSLAQIKKGERFMAEGRYIDAARALRKDFYVKDNVYAGYLLAQSYYKMQEYEDAMDVMNRIDISRLETSEQIRFYADVLIANEDYSQAYLHLILLYADDQSDALSLSWLQKTADLLRWDTLPSNSSQLPVSGINTIYNEYAPFATPQGELWFVSDLNSIQSIFPASYNDQNLHMFYRTKPRTEQLDLVTLPTMLVKNRRHYYHDGHMDIWPGQSKYAVTMRDIDAPLSYSRMEIFFTTLSGKQDDLIPFPYNDKHNTGHPTFNSDGTRMYFASDRPGGYGQMDIWYCDWENGQWQPPVNLGPLINTPGNEVFPRFYDERLYFSSDRPDMGYGGLDIYFTSLLSEFKYVQNMRTPINTPYDEFSITFIDMERGYYASNRKGGAGGDDIYAFGFFPEKVNQPKLVARVVKDLVPPGAIYELRNGANELQYKGVMDHSGIIPLDNLVTNEIYTLYVQYADIKSDALLAIGLPGREPLQNIPQAAKGQFRFELINYHDYYLLTSEAENVVMATFDLMGRLVSETEQEELAKALVMLRNKDGQVESKVNPNQAGVFKFKDLKTGEKYDLETQGLKDPHEIDVIGGTGAIVQSLQPVGPNAFSYTRVQQDPSMEGEIEVTVPRVVAIVPGIDMEAGQSATLFDKDNNKLYDCGVDEDGFITMGALTAGREYRLQVDGQNLSKFDKLVILDASGDTSQTVRPADPSNYRFEYMLYDGYDRTAAKQDVASASGPDLFKGRIEGVSKPGGIEIEVLNAKGKVVDKIRTTSGGFFTFKNVDPNQSYTIRSKDLESNKPATLSIYDEEGKFLSEANAVKGIFSINLSAIQPVPATGMLLKSTLAGKISSPVKEAMELTLYDKDGKLLAVGYSTPSGEFQFANVPFSDNYILKAQGEQVNGIKMRIPASRDSLSLMPRKDGLWQIDMLNASRETSIAGRLEARKGSKGSSEVSIYDELGNPLGMVQSSGSGQFIFPSVPVRERYYLQVGNPDVKNIKVHVPNTADSLSIAQNEDKSWLIDFSNIPSRTREEVEPAEGSFAGAVFDLPMVYFDFNSARLHEKSQASLNLLVELLHDQPGMKVEIQAHTDSRGNDAYNLTLSQRRAESVVNYLRSKGIGPERLKAKGYGESRLVNRCADGVRCTEAEHALNRRTSFAVVE